MIRNLRDDARRLAARLDSPTLAAAAFAAATGAFAYWLSEPRAKAAIMGLGGCLMGFVVGREEMARARGIALRRYAEALERTSAIERLHERRGSRRWRLVRAGLLLRHLLRAAALVGAFFVVLDLVFLRLLGFGDP